ncbi:YbdD/YjiX family protein, partial [Dermacoccus barathri]|uniref:YbdD/YjiX family protein n=1 Tax=Dermacoccus barathri TaxID=322601 RepID=UPI0031FA0814
MPRCGRPASGRRPVGVSMLDRTTTECRLEQGQPGGLRRAFGAVRWYWASVMGDNHYERYLAHHERTHPGEA